MSAHVSLNLLNEFGGKEIMRGLPSILSHFCNEFNFVIMYAMLFWMSLHNVRKYAILMCAVISLSGTICDKLLLCIPSQRLIRFVSCLASLSMFCPISSNIQTNSRMQESVILGLR